MGEIEMRNGIRQGCTGLPILFVMVASMIIERTFICRMGFEIWKMRILELF